MQRKMFFNQNEPDYTAVKYGSLYNWFVTQGTGDSSLISADMVALGWAVPSDTDFTTLTDYVSSQITLGNLPDIGVGRILKSKRTLTGIPSPLEIVTTDPYWTYDANFGVDTLGLNLNASGYRYLGPYIDKNSSCILWSTSEYNTSDANYITVIADDGVVYNNHLDKTCGVSIRTVNNSTTLINGQTGTYIGNDGKVYRTICIGTQEWLADNLAETKYANGDTIPTVTDNATWAALTTGARCAYENDESNVLI